MYGMAEGLTGIFVQPYKGARDEGPIGALKGFGKGTASLFTKTASGLLQFHSYFVFFDVSNTYFWELLLTFIEQEVLV